MMKNQPAPTEPWKQYQARLKRLENLPYSFAFDQREQLFKEAGWLADQYEIELPSEALGMPLEGGTFARAQAILRDYKFPPSNLIRGYYYPEQPLEKRIMLLRARFLIFTFYFGVKITSVIDAHLKETDTDEYQWGYQYATLEGHFENGEITFLLIKRLNTGQVFFRIKAYSRVGKIRNPFYRLGFRLFGRSLQRRFAKESLMRLKQMVTASP
jgi:uncharacterized protein (UPF0548 family)